MGLIDLLIQEAFKDLDPGDFPFSLGVEATNHCNLRCPMCPREAADRGYGNMDFELFRSIADQAAGRDHTVFLPTGFGESFIHPEFREMLQYLKESGVKITCLITNATYLDEKNCNALVDSQISFVNISLDGTVKDVYEKIRVNANYEKVVENVQRLFRIREERGSALPYIVLRMIKMEETADDAERFQQMWAPYLKENDEVTFSNYQTWSNTVEDHRVEKPEGMKLLESLPEGQKKPPCRMIYKTLQIYYDGRATPCCYDYDCTMEVGNVQDESIEEIWKGERLAEIRRLHEEGRLDEISICKNCQEYTP